MKSVLQDLHFVPVVAPIADAFAGTLNSDIISMKNCAGILFIVNWGVGTTGTTVITVDACSTVGAAATTAIIFKYKILLGAADPVTEDTPGALTIATNAGYTTAAGSFQTHLIEVDAAVVQKTGYDFVRLTCTEDTDDPILGGIMSMQFGLRHKGDTFQEAIS
jgi:hypothetical protein